MGGTDFTKGIFLRQISYRAHLIRGDIPRRQVYWLKRDIDDGISRRFMIGEIILSPKRKVFIGNQLSFITVVMIGELFEIWVGKVRGNARHFIGRDSNV